MTLDEAITEWRSSKRRMGCVAATTWLCTRVPGYYAIRKTRYTPEGDMYSHVMATDGIIIVDLAPYADEPAPKRI